MKHRIYPAMRLSIPLLALLCFFISVPKAWAAECPLFIVNVDGTGFKRFTQEPNQICGSPDWSPDGKWIAYDTWPDGESFSASKICVMSADGKTSKIVGAGAMPSWSPDGRQLVCHTYDSPQTIVVMNADGSGRETIINHWGSPRWSPKYDRIASLDSRGRGITLFDLRNGQERLVRLGPHSAKLGFSISPNGSRFCFGDYEGGAAVATLDSKSQLEPKVKWLVKTGTVGHTSWSPDGQRVVFEWQKTNDSLLQLYLKDVDTNDPPQRLLGQDPNRHNSNADWSPDGKSILFNSFPATKTK